MSFREEQCNKVCRILDDVLANRPTERDSLITAVRIAFSALNCSEIPNSSDSISRQAAIDALWAERMKHSEEMERNLETCSFALRADNKARRNRVEEDIEIIKQLPPAQPKELDTLIKALEQEHKKLREMQKALPEIIYCKDCAKHNKGVGDFEVLPDGRRSWIWKDRACPLVSWRGKAQEHEFDYQYCVFAERRTE